MAEGDLRWKYNVGKEMHGGVIVDSNGVIYAGTAWVGAGAKIIAINSDGTLKWEYDVTTGSVYSGLALSNDESVIYAGCLGGKLYAIYTATGNLKWEYTDADISEIWSGIAVDINDNIYFGTESGPTLKSLAYDGTLRWSTADNWKSNYSQITIKDTSVLYCATNVLSQIRLSDGAIDWTYPAAAEGTGISIASDGTIYYGGGYGYEYAINSDGTLKWRYALVNGAFRANAIGSNGRIWCTDDNGVNSKVVCLNPDGSLDWDYAIPNWIGEPWDTTGLALDSNDVVFIGCRDNKLYAVNPDGTLRWTYTAGNQIRSAIKFSPSEDTVYFGCNDGYLYAVEKLPSAPTCGIVAIGDKVMLCPIGNRHGNIVALKSGNAALTDKALIAPLNNQAALKLDFRNCKSKQGDKIICVPISGTKKNILGLR